MISSRLPIFRLILVPSIITLAVTLLRLTGELMNWSPALFNREAGGGGALIGIVWLVPIFGAYFGWKLARAGEGPASNGKAIGYPLLGLLLMFAGALTVALGWNLYARLTVFWLATAAAAALQYPAWPQLFKTLLAYGLAARIPVAIIMLIAMIGDWQTHYDLPPPGLPAMGVFAKWVWIGLVPQLLLWTGFTIVVGALFGSIAGALARRGPAPRVARA